MAKPDRARAVELLDAIEHGRLPAPVPIVEFSKELRAYIEGAVDIVPVLKDLPRDWPVQHEGTTYTCPLEIRCYSAWCAGYGLDYKEGPRVTGPTGTGAKELVETLRQLNERTWELQR